MKSTSLKDFQIIGKLGEGSFSIVYKGKIKIIQVVRNSDMKEYALKKVKMIQLKLKEKENSLNEVRILASLNNPYIIQYKEAFIDDNNLCLIMEIAKDGDLLNKIKKFQNQRQIIPEIEIWKTLNHIILGLNALHKMKILHRDIKCANIFLSKDENNQIITKLGDLNVSKVAKQGLLRTQIGTPYYASPEVWKDKPYDSKSDIWSVGCIIYEMAALRPPFRANDMDGLFKKVCLGKYDPLPKSYSQDLNTIIGDLLQVNPIMRPSCEQIIQNQIFQRNSNKQNTNQYDNTQYDLLDTIELPKNLNNLKGKLPSAQYQKQQQNIEQVSQNDKLRKTSNGHIKIENYLSDNSVKLKKDNIDIQKQNNQYMMKYNQKEILQPISDKISLKNENYEYNHKMIQSPSQQQLQNQLKYSQIQNLPQNLLNRGQIKYHVNQSLIGVPQQNQLIYNNQNQSIPKNYLEKQKQMEKELSPLLKKEQLQNWEKDQIDQIQRHQMYIRDKIVQNKKELYTNQDNINSQQKNYISDKENIANNQSKNNLKKNEVSKSYQLPYIQIKQQQNIRYSDRNQDNNLFLNDNVVSNSNKVRLAAGQQILNNQVSKPTWWG